MQCPPAVPWGFVVSITRKGRHRSLHHVGMCWREPGRHFKEFEVWGDIMPPEDSLQSRCKDCFRMKGVREAPENSQGAEEVEDEGSSSSSSSTGLGPPAKKPKAAAADGSLCEVVKIEDLHAGH